MDKLPGNFLLMLTFFTRLPLPDSLGKHISPSNSLTDAAPLFPVVGLLIGAVTAIIWLVASAFLPPPVAAGLTMLAGILLTGALHEDGLADCADGLGATSDREKALDIMRDSTIGTYGGIALVMSVGLRWACLSLLSPMAGASALIIAHANSRSAMTIAMKTSQYARKQGLGKMASGTVSDLNFAIATLIAVAIAIVFGGFTGLIGTAVALVLAVTFLKYLEMRIGGYTGDGLGAMQQISEITLLVFLAGAWT